MMKRINALLLLSSLFMVSGVIFAEGNNGKVNGKNTEAKRTKLNNKRARKTKRLNSEDDYSVQVSSSEVDHHHFRNGTRTSCGDRSCRMCRHTRHVAPICEKEVSVTKTVAPCKHVETIERYTCPPEYKARQPKEDDCRPARCEKACS